MFRVLLVLMLFVIGEIFADPAPLIPRSVLFAKADRTSVSISHAGDKISYLSRADQQIVLVITNVDGVVLNRFTLKPSRNISKYVWSKDDRYLLVLQDTNGDENDHVICLNIKDGSRRDLTPFSGSKSFVMASSDKYPNEVIIGCNKRDSSKFDAYRVNLDTGNMCCIFENSHFDSVIFDNDLQVRMASRINPDGGMSIFFVQDGCDKHPEKSKLYKVVSFQDSFTYELSHFSKDNKMIYALTAEGRDKPALVAIDAFTGNETIIYENDDEPLEGMVNCVKSYRPVIVSLNLLESRYQALDKNYERDLCYLRAFFKGDRFQLVSADVKGKHYIVCSTASDKVPTYYLYIRNPETNTPIAIKCLFSAQPLLACYSFQPMEALKLKSRDGLDLICYLTRANGYNSSRPSPLVVYVHGGPWARDEYGFNKVVQFLANRGYSVLQVNYRGSTGFGKRFANAISKQLENVRNDLLDAAQWAINNGIADASKIAIMGGSFGGYSVLAGLAYTPQFFCCGVDVVGPSNWVSLLQNIPSYWAPYIVQWYNTVGDPKTTEGLQYMQEMSPLTYVDSICKPLIVFQGANDPRVNKVESDQIVAKLKEKGQKVAYVLYPDEGHGFLKEHNNMSYLALTELFLAQVLGGWCEPFHAGEFAESSHQILEEQGVSLRGVFH